MDQSAEKTIFQLEKLYQTQPPQQIASSKVASIFEYLIFSGSPVYLSSGNSTLDAKLAAPLFVVDYQNSILVLEFSELGAHLDKRDGAECNIWL